MKWLKAQFNGDVAARKMLRYGALAAPISMMFYGLMIQIGTLPSTNNSPTLLPSTLVVISFCWLILGSMTFLTQQSHSWVVSALELGAYFILAMIQTWFVSGFSSPFSAYWVMLLVATYVLFNRIGLHIGVIVLIATLAISTLIIGEPTTMDTIMSLMTAITVLVTSLIIVTVYSAQQTSHQDLIASHIREETERDRLTTLMNNVTDAVFSTDSHGIVKIYNSAALSILDTNQKIDNRFISELMHIENSYGKEVDIFEELSKNNTIRQRDDLIMNIGGSDQLKLEATFAPVQGSNTSPNTPDNYVLILRDITRVKSLEEERDEFISVVSHELRTPVAIAEGSLSNAEIMAERGHKGKIVEAIGEAHKQVIFLSKMVNDLSMLSRAERGLSDEAETIDVTELAHQLHREYTPETEAKGLGLNLDITGKPGQVHTSRLYLKELLQNFITNAIKYTQKGSVTLKIYKQKGKIVFKVIDTGIGISKADQKKIFERFYRAEDYRTRETSGTGLGLYVATKLARKIGCDIEMESRLNHGSTFSFCVKAADKK